tara:strand:+ start:29940 stop:30221 length:282 start_codon:yes stop_codon:yes gene_type:complete
MNLEKTIMADAADKLAALFDIPFGGKPKGRFRISNKLVRQALQRRRLYEDDVRRLGRELLERGFVLVDMDSFFVVLSANSFVNYRRANEESLR